MSTNIVFTTSSGREFHSLIVRGKKEILQTYFFVLRITNLKGWFPRVFLSLVCLDGLPLKNSSVRPAVFLLIG